MKIKFFALFFAVTMAMGNISISRAEDSSIAAITDVALVRPGCFLATVLGSVVFVVALPIAAASGSVRSTANTLVVTPAEATFTRPIGDYSTLE